ncbi:MAG: response regulator [Pseudomonadota bacterium]
MSFPLFCRPGSVVFVDDDRAYLEMLAEVIPEEWDAHFFSSPLRFISTLKEQISPWEEDAWKHQNIVNAWHQGQLLIPQILEYWRDDGHQRYGFTQVCVVDYSMPGMSGLKALHEIRGWKGARVLLTGRADEFLGISAFNRGLIDKFIPKQSSELHIRLPREISSLQAVPQPWLNVVWQSTLSRKQRDSLNLQEVQSDLQNLIQQQGWVEYIVIGSPFGMLAIDASGDATWLQLKIAGPGIKPHEAHETLARYKLRNRDRQATAGAQPRSPQSEPFPLGDGALRASLFPLDATQSPGKSASLDAYRAKLSNREILD